MRNIIIKASFTEELIRFAKFKITNAVIGTLNKLRNRKAANLISTNNSSTLYTNDKLVKASLFVIDFVLRPGPKTKYILISKP